MNDYIHDSKSNLLESISTGIMILDIHGNVVAYNQKAVLFLEVEILDLIRDRLDDLLKENSLQQILNDLANDNTQEVTFEYNSTRKILNITFKLMTFHSDKRKEIVVTIEDISEYKKSESIRRTFIDSVLFKMKTPLTTINLVYSILNNNESECLSSDDKDALKMAAHEAHRLVTLTDDLQCLFTIESGLLSQKCKITATEFQNILSRVLHDLERLQKRFANIKKRITIKGNSKVKILVDTEMIHKVLCHILKNAIIFSPDDKPISIQIETKQDSATIAIQDKGIGIANAELPHIFEQFYRINNAITRENDGEGIGLFIAKNYIETMNGVIYCESEIDKGSTFYLTLKTQRG